MSQRYNAIGMSDVLKGHPESPDHVRGYQPGHDTQIRPGFLRVQMDDQAREAMARDRPIDITTTGRESGTSRTTRTRVMLHRCLGLLP